MRKRDVLAPVVPIAAVVAVLTAAGFSTASPGASALPAPRSAQIEPSAPTPTEVPSEVPTEVPTEGPSEAPDGSGPRTIDDAVFAWSISPQSNAQSHNPLTNNFLSAGAADPGRGGMVLPSRKWSARSGNVEIQKVNVAGVWRQATWAGLGTDANGSPIGLYGPFSGHRVRITDGSGTLDPERDDADLQWRGTFTVVYYGGNTVFTLTDPKLTVNGGVGRLTATGGGWAADRLDPTVWQAVAPQVVPVVELRDVDVTRTGLEVTPGYRGVVVSGPETQLRTEADWGSFPQEFVSFLEPMGASQFWYSTGLQSDWTKLPDPIAVGWEGADPESPKPTAPVPSKKPRNPLKTAPPKKPEHPSTPRETAVPAQTPAGSSGGSAGLALPALVPQLGALPTGSGPGTLLGLGGAPPQVTAAAAAEARLTSAQTLCTGWVVGGVLLLGAVLLLMVPTAPRRPRPARL